MKQKLMSWNAAVLRLIASPKFIIIILGLFLVQALWIALTARYPQAFDENFHFGLIELHAQQWLPYFNYQPDGASIYGSVARDPSYLYHYVLSLAYRLTVAITANQTAQIIVLRLINVGLFAIGILAFRRLFQELSIPRATQNVALLFFVVLPVVPLLAGQISYDNAALPLTGLLLLYATRLIKILRDDSGSSDRLPLTVVFAFLVTGLAGCLVKFSYLPIFAAAVGVVGYFTVRRLCRKPPRALRFSRGTTWKLVLVSLLLVSSLGLAFERYGLNVVAYHSPTPSCDRVLSVDECLEYAPWARNFNYAHTYPSPKFIGYLVYPFVWIGRMVWESVFTINSLFHQGKVLYFVHQPAVISYAVTWLVVAASLISLVMFRKVLFKDTVINSLIVITLFYTAALFFQNISDYHETGEVVAVHGRYLLPFYPLIFVVLCAGLSQFVRRLPRGAGNYRGIILALVFVLFMNGGGITNWIVRSNNSWYWQNAPAARVPNDIAKAILSKIVYVQPE